MAAVQKILTLDIGSAQLKLAEFDVIKGGGLEISRYLVRSLGMDLQSEEDRPAYLVNSLREMVAEWGLKSGSIYVSIPGQSVFTRFVKLPIVQGEKLDQLVAMEAQENVPFPIDEVIWDYQPLGQTEELDVMIAAVKSELVEDIADCLATCGLKPIIIDVAPLALFNSARYNQIESEQCTLIVDIGARATDLIFVENGHFFIRSIPVAGNTITQQLMREFDMSFSDAEQMKTAHAFVAFGGAFDGPASKVADTVSKTVRLVMTRLHAELNRSINFYRSQQGGGKPVIVLLSGGSSIIPHTDTFLKDKLDITVDYINPFCNVSVAESISSDDICANIHVLGNNVGLALRASHSCPIEMDLIPDQVKQERKNRKKRPVYIIALVALLLTILSVGSYFQVVSRMHTAQLEELSGEVRRLSAMDRGIKKLEGQAQQVVQRLGTLGELGTSRDFWIRLLDEIRHAMPDGMWVTQVKAVTEVIPPETKRDPERRAITKLDVSGVGYLDKVATAEPIIILRDALRASDLFGDATEIKRQPSPKPDDYLREFEIRVVLEQPIYQ